MPALGKARLAAAWCLVVTLAAAEAAAIDGDGLDGRVLCGYQGWFAAEGDGAGIGWRHWRSGRGRLTFDLLPDVGDLPPEERFTLPIDGPDGPHVEVFSSFLAPTVRRHFRWMREYGIDGVFVQRFAVYLRDPGTLAHHTTVLGHCRDAALAEGRTYAVMYDLRGLQAGRTGDVLEPRPIRCFARSPRWRMSSVRGRWADTAPPTRPPDTPTATGRPTSPGAVTARSTTCR